MHDADRVREITQHRSKAGKIGGKRSLKTMTAEQRRERAKRAVAAREAKKLANRKSS
jgi:hypothetical protein